MRHVSHVIYKFSRGWVVLVALFIFVVFLAFVLPAESAKAAVSSGGAESPDTSFFYTRADLYRMAEAFGKAGRAAYVRARFSFDIVWPLAYTFFLLTVTSWALLRVLPTESRWRLLNLAALPALVFDYLENVSAALVMTRYPQMTAVFDWLAPFATVLKWLTLSLAFLVMLAALLSTLVKVIKRL